MQAGALHSPVPPSHPCLCADKSNARPIKKRPGVSAQGVVGSLRELYFFSKAFKAFCRRRAEASSLLVASTLATSCCQVSCGEG